MEVLQRAFYERDTVVVARELIGKKLVRRLGDQLLVGIISQTEAYHSEDPACHAYRGRCTERTRALFGPVGHAYIYRSYGIHWCLNLVARAPSMQAGGVLIRELIPVAGMEIMQKQREVSAAVALPERSRRVRRLLSELCSGPGKLTQALGITKALYGSDVTSSDAELFVIEGQDIQDKHIIASPRIGISVAQELPWCFTLKF